MAVFSARLRRGSRRRGVRDVREIEKAPAPSDPVFGGGEAGASAFVWSVWAGSTLLATSFVARYGMNLPLWDDFHIVSVLIDARPFSVEWLWEQCNEHRIAVPKLILLPADRLAGGDIRAGMFLSVAALSALSAALVRLAGRSRGGLRSSDALIPLLFLSLGQFANLLWSFQFSCVLPTVLATAYLIPIVGRASWPGPATAIVCGLGLALLPPCGGTGIVFVPPLALWVLWTALATARSGRPGSRRLGALIAMSTVPGLALTALYFVGFHKGLHPENTEGFPANVRTGIQFLAGGVGLPASTAWPWSGAVMLGLIGLASLVLVRTWASRPDERPRVVGMSAFLAGMLAMAAAVGWGRGWAGNQAGFQARYVTMAAPLWCWLALVFRTLAPPAAARQIPNALFAGLCVLAWPNVQAGVDHAEHTVPLGRALVRDIVEGKPLYQVLRKHVPFFYPSQDEAARWLLALRRAGFGPFRYLRDNPPFRETSLPLRPTEIYLARWEGTTAHVTNVDPQITF